MAGSPKYLQIASELLKRIEEGALKPGERLPTEMELATKWNCSTSTVKDALSELRRIGCIQTRPREGSFVLAAGKPLTITLNDRHLSADDALAGFRLGGGEGPALLEEARRQGLSLGWEPPMVAIEKARPRQLEAFGVSPDENLVVVKRTQKRFIDGRPHSIQYSYFTMDLALKAPRLLDLQDIEEGFLAYLAGLGYVQVGYMDEFDARTPLSEEMEFLALSKDGLAVIEHLRTGYDQEGRPLRLTVTVYRPGNNKIRFLTGKVPGDEDGPDGKEQDEPRRVTP